MRVYRHGHEPRVGDDTAHRRCPRGLRGVRCGRRPRRPVDRTPHRRQRAEPQPLLAPPVQPGRLECRSGCVPCAPRRDLRRSQGGVARCHGVRRRRLAARNRSSERAPSHPLADDVHPGSRSRLSGERPHAAGDGRAVDPRLRRQLEHGAHRRPPAEHVDRRRGLRQARQPARRRFRRDRATGLGAPDPLRRVRRRVGDPGGKAALYTGSEPATTKPVGEATQATYYQQALALAFCQPNVAGMLLFLSSDERGRANWQSGIHYVDGTPKTSKSTRDSGRSTARRADPSRVAPASSFPSIRRSSLRHALGREARSLPRQLPLRPRLPLLDTSRERA